MDRCREFWREGGVVGTILEWLSGPGFKLFVDQAGASNEPWTSAQEFRQRYLLQALRGRAPVI